MSSPWNAARDAGDGGTVAGDEFAGLLRELKERSGLSYGALARRLHVSTSTLHRYVNGDAVPTDYAPVERLARACRATPEELVDLHRRWVLADALRGRKGAVAGSPPGAAADADGDGDGGERGGAGASAAGAVPDVVAGTGPETGQEAVAQAPVRRNRRAVALAAAGAVVLAAVASTALVVRLGSGRSDDDTKGHAVALGIPPGARLRADSTPTGARQGVGVAVRLARRRTHGVLLVDRRGGGPGRLLREGRRRGRRHRADRRRRPVQVGRPVQPALPGEPEGRARCRRRPTRRTRGGGSARSVGSPAGSRCSR
ncbi:helix-turn-helix domain-containing protein [Streptomyces sp. LN325]|uniref:helix-turn-helix domain-containing protein n=1 Tax=Streptomyces sp. LN325 TaxID=3112976 RepID=UPI00370FD3B1